MRDNVTNFENFDPKISSNRYTYHDDDPSTYIYQAIQDLIRSRQNKEKSDDDKQCVICMDKPKEYACIPCGHLSLCGQCKDRFDYRCPLCRRDCDSVIKIYQ